MASDDEPEIVERAHKGEDTEDEDKKVEKSGFMEKMKGFIHGVGEKIKFGKPTADVSGIHISHISLHNAEIVVDVLVKNPNPLPIPLVDINYCIDSDERKLVFGLIPDAGTIHPHGEQIVKIPVNLVYDEIKETYHDIKPGSIIPYRVKVDLIIDVPVFGRITIPPQKTGEIPIPYKPDIDVEKIKFKRFSFEEATANINVKIENKNDFDLGLKDLDYEFWLGDVCIGSADLVKSGMLAKKDISYIDLPITFRPKDFGSAVWDMIRGMKGNIDVDTPFGNMKLPISKEGGTTFFKKKRKDGGSDDDDDDEVCLRIIISLLLIFNFPLDSYQLYSDQASPCELQSNENVQN